MTGAHQQGRYAGRQPPGRSGLQEERRTGTIGIKGIRETDALSHRGKSPRKNEVQNEIKYQRKEGVVCVWLPQP